ncbi:MAG: hypothetical protein IPG56_15345 [Caulobacteraceae bacterium]|nr:hypothetical protein [Caulobacteraceae bacterium]
MPAARATSLAATGSGARLASLGFAVERQPIAAVAITEAEPQLRVGSARAEVAVHCLGAPGTYPAETRPLSVWGAPEVTAPVPRGAIVVAHLPSQRWSSALHPIVRETVTHAFDAGASALVLVTHGPSGDLIHLNRTREAGSQDGPIALMAPRDWAGLQPALVPNPTGTVSLNARAIERPAFNVVARIDRGAARWLVVSTPRSGWGPCVGERGPGIAAFLELARWAPQRFPRFNLAFVCTSSHEFENAGGAAFLESGAPTPDSTALWLHLGAGFAARDWHEVGRRLLPLPAPTHNAFLVATAPFVEQARAAFSGVAGLEAAYEASQGAAGELQNVITAGYGAVIGMFGAHRFHHTAQDDLRCVDPVHSIDAITRLKRLLEASIPADRRPS